MTISEVISWLEERRDNCIRISNLAGCDDPEEWRVDARYFAAAIAFLTTDKNGGMAYDDL